MSSTHSDSDSKKVYRQPEKPTIQDVIAAWKKVAPKVEELFEKVYDYDVSYVATDSALEPVCAELEIANVELKKVKAELLKAKAMEWSAKLIHKILPSNTEDKQRSDQIEEYEQAIKQKSSRIEEYEQMIKKQKEPLHKLKEQILTVANEVDEIVNNTCPLTETWTTTLIGNAKKDLLHATIKPEELIHIQGIATTAINLAKEIRIVQTATHYIRTSLIYGITYFVDGNPYDTPRGKPIGHHSVGTDLRIKWTYGYRSRRDYPDMRRNFNPSIDATNESIKETISTSITTLEQIARFFSSPLPGKSNTQTA
jgi:hypothetical protein